MRLSTIWRTAAAAATLIASADASAYEPQTLEIGAQAPGFDLPGIDDRRYTLDDFGGKSVLVVIFTTNHCPDAIASYGRMCRMVDDYRHQDVAFVAINANDPQAVMLSEMRWTKYDDSFASMKIVAKEEGFNLPYLYDGETQQVVKAYGAVATPHVFIFDAQRQLRYTGRLDNGRRNPDAADKSEARDAIDALLAGQPVPIETTRVFGCSVKWSDKRALVAEAERAWNELPVDLAPADDALVKRLLRNEADSLKMINVWSTSCGPCLEEFAGLVQTYRRFQNHPFQFITISVDAPAKKESVLEFLEEQHAAVARRTMRILTKHDRQTNNFIYAGDDLEDLAKALDPQWSGAQPLTLLVAPDGEILFRHTGRTDLGPLHDAIVDYVRKNFLK